MFLLEPTARRVRTSSVCRFGLFAQAWCVERGTSKEMPLRKSKQEKLESGLRR